MSARPLRRRDHLRVRGCLTIITLDALGREVERASWHNLVTTLGKQAMLHFVAGDGAVTAGAQYLAVGTGAATPAASDTTLVTELARQPITQSALTGTLLTLQTYFTQSQANGTWTELGLFGNGATAAANSGTMFTHALLSYVKDSTKQTIVSYTIALS